MYIYIFIYTHIYFLLVPYSTFFFSKSAFILDLLDVGKRKAFPNYLRGLWEFSEVTFFETLASVTAWPDFFFV